MKAFSLQRWWGFLGSRKGSLTVELVVTFPVLIAALAFAYEFGRFFMAHHDTVNNVREASRFISRHPDPSSADAANIVTNIIKTGRPSGGYEPDWMTNADISIQPTYSTFSASDFRTGGDVIRIRVIVDFPVQLLGFIGTGSDRASISYAVVDQVRYFGD